MEIKEINIENKANMHLYQFASAIVARWWFRQCFTYLPYLRRENIHKKYCILNTFVVFSLNISIKLRCKCVFFSPFHPFLSAIDTDVEWNLVVNFIRCFFLYLIGIKAISHCIGKNEKRELVVSIEWREWRGSTNVTHWKNESPPHIEYLNCSLFGRSSQIPHIQSEKMSF